VALFFLVLGTTNLAKGLLFGTGMVLIPIAGFLLWNADLRRIGNYLWLPGWVIFAVVAVAWPVAAWLRYPDVLELWNYDLGGRLDGSYVEINEPIWYYPLNLLWMLAPWTLVIPFGLWCTGQRAWRERYSPERFLWCWALLVPAVFSLPHGKHHHYLLHALAPWAVLSSFGLMKLREQMLAWPRLLRNPFTSLATTALPAMVAVWLLRSKIPGPEWLPTAVLVACPCLTVALSWAFHNRNALLAARALFASLAIAYGFGHWLAGAYADQHRHDAAFLARVRQIVPADEPLLVDMNVQPLRGFFCLFYLGKNTVPLHNLSFALDERIARDEVYLLTWYGLRAEIAQFATYDVIAQTQRAGRERTVDERLTLFRVKYRSDVPRVSANGVRVSPMQAIYRTRGPDLARF
jgi:4-amino-4-deoxy-L-arabinose transferase-like glycosyltransferase